MILNVLVTSRCPQRQLGSRTQLVFFLWEATFASFNIPLTFIYQGECLKLREKNTWGSWVLETENCTFSSCHVSESVWGKCCMMRLETVNVKGNLSSSSSSLDIKQGWNQFKGQYPVWHPCCSLWKGLNISAPFSLLYGYLSQCEVTWFYLMCTVHLHYSR